MGQNRYKGIECDQCGRCGKVGLRLNFSVEDLSIHGTERHSIDDVSFFATFCCKDCLKRFLDRQYFDSILELEESDE